MTPEEYDQRIKEMERRNREDREAIIAEYEQRRTDKNGLKEDAHTLLVNNSADAAQRIVNIALGRVFGKNGEPPALTTQLKAAQFVYEYGVIHNVEKDKDEMDNIIEKLTNPSPVPVTDVEPVLNEGDTE